MRFLADAGVSPKTVEFLTQHGHEAIHVRTLALQRAPDLEIVEFYDRNGYTKNVLPAAIATYCLPPTE